MSLSIGHVSARVQNSFISFRGIEDNMNLPSVIFTNPNENNVKRVEKRDLSYGGKRIVTDYGDIGLGKCLVTKTEMKDIDTKGVVRQVSKTTVDREHGTVTNQMFLYDENGQLAKEFKVENVSLGVVKTTLCEYTNDGKERQVTVNRFSFGKPIGISEESVERLNDNGTWVFKNSGIKHRRAV